MTRSAARAVEQIRAELRRLHAYRHIALDAVAFGHEVRNPIAALAIRLELALDDETNDDRRAWLRSLLQTCDEVSALTKAFLDRARRPETDPSVDARVDALCGDLSGPAVVPAAARHCAGRSHRRP